MSATEPSAEGTALRGLTEYVVRNVVDNTDAVVVDLVERGHVVDLRLTVDPEETGKVIGRQGRVVKALRGVLAAAGTRAGKRVNLEIGG